ncbi:phosphatase PAP2 family protein [Papillibacter cinnamivorans]|uniref:Undecaprenyl-diphosphatase n=1 Tax=Papillibacter cinnamivorans DSM 12816 TaxID=1122930 RepID=A0A1W1ZFQ3_9FIRM|nr:phosphatase PAP2 family protein [Papillibacter cinnamivorans]SMC47176.1 undecaprenyl-diphosphatase [Papillibacter cinnamivorans DSM 12816]
MNKKNLWLVIVPLILFAMLAVCVKAGLTVGFEGWAYSETVEHMSPLYTGIVKAITHIGDSAVVIVFCLLLIALPKSRKTIALPVSLSVILSAVLNIVLKNLFVRQRPDILRLINETSYSFPSGHAMINATLYTMLILLIFRYVPNKLRRLALSFLCLALTAAIGYSRVYLGVHYAGDVLGGWLIGFAVSLLVFNLWKDKVWSKKQLQ